MGMPSFPSPFSDTLPVLPGALISRNAPESVKPTRRDLHPLTHYFPPAPSCFTLCLEWPRPTPCSITVTNPMRMPCPSPGARAAIFKTAAGPGPGKRGEGLLNRPRALPPGRRCFSSGRCLPSIAVNLRPLFSVQLMLLLTALPAVLSVSAWVGPARSALQFRAPLR